MRIFKCCLFFMRLVNTTWCGLTVIPVKSSRGCHNSSQVKFGFRLMTSLWVLEGRSCVPYPQRCPSKKTQRLQILMRPGLIDAYLTGLWSHKMLKMCNLSHWIHKKRLLNKLTMVYAIKKKKQSEQKVPQQPFCETYIILLLPENTVGSPEIIWGASWKQRICGLYMVC